MVLPHTGVVDHKMEVSVHSEHYILVLLLQEALSPAAAVVVGAVPVVVPAIVPLPAVVPRTDFVKVVPGTLQVVMVDIGLVDLLDEDMAGYSLDQEVHIHVDIHHNSVEDIVAVADPVAFEVDLGGEAHFHMVTLNIHFVVVVVVTNHLHQTMFFQYFPLTP